MSRIKEWLEALLLATAGGCSASLIESGIIAEKRYESTREFSKSEMAIIMPPTFI